MYFYENFFDKSTVYFNIISYGLFISKRFCRLDEAVGLIQAATTPLSENSGELRSFLSGY